MENLWKMIAEARCVALDEEFKWNGSIYKIAEYDGLLVLYHSWVKSNSVVSFIEGYGKIEKIPFCLKLVNTIGLIVILSVAIIGITLLFTKNENC